MTMTWICQECDHRNAYWRNRCEGCNWPQNGWSDKPVNSNEPRPGETPAEFARRIRKNTVMGAG